MWLLMKPKARHLVALTLFVPALLVALYFITTNTDAYEEATRFVAQDKQVTASIGQVQKTRLKFWRGFEFTGDSADFSIEATSGKGAFVVDVHLRRTSGNWHVTVADVYAIDAIQRISRIEP